MAFLMSFPKILERSNKLKKIPHPEDFGLEAITEKIFSSDKFEDSLEYEKEWYGYKYGYKKRETDETEESDFKVLDFAKNFIYNLETDIGKIKNNQKVLQVLINNKDFRDLILKRTIDADFNYIGEWKKEFDYTKARTESYVSYLTKLAQVFPETHTKLEEFRKHILSLKDDERFKELEQIIDDINNPGTIELNATFNIQNRPYEIKFECNRMTAIKKFKSGAVYENSFMPQTEFYLYKLNFDDQKIFSIIHNELKRDYNKDFFNKNCRMHLVIDEKEKKASFNGTIDRNKLNFLRTIKNGKLEYDNNDAKIESINLETDLKLFGLLTEHLSSEKYLKELKKFDEDIEEFIDGLTELRYLALAADYYHHVNNNKERICTPDILESSKQTSMKKMINPNLITKGTKRIVENEAYFQKSDEFIITGSDNNGKTVYMNAIGINQAFAQAGLFTFADSARISPVDNIFSHYIRPNQIITGESRYANELNEIKNIFNEITSNSLLLMDESFSGTSPRDGMMQLRDVIAVTKDLGATLYVATHYHKLADLAGSNPRIKNLHCMIQKREGLGYTYKIVPGISKESDGNYLAKYIGADRYGLKRILFERTEKGDLILKYNFNP
ncbi:MAG: MutS-related protein [Nanoarchaeota archaeon]